MEWILSLFKQHCLQNSSRLQTVSHQISFTISKISYWSDTYIQQNPDEIIHTKLSKDSTESEKSIHKRRAWVCDTADDNGANLQLTVRIGSWDWRQRQHQHQQEGEKDIDTDTINLADTVPTHACIDFFNKITFTVRTSYVISHYFIYLFIIFTVLPRWMLLSLWKRGKKSMHLMSLTLHWMNPETRVRKIRLVRTNKYCFSFSRAETICYCPTLIYTSLIGVFIFRGTSIVGVNRYCNCHFCWHRCLFFLM